MGNRDGSSFGSCRSEIAIVTSNRVVAFGNKTSGAVVERFDLNTRVGKVFFGNSAGRPFGLVKTRQVSGDGTASDFFPGLVVVGFELTGEFHQVTGSLLGHQDVFAFHGVGRDIVSVERSKTRGKRVAVAAETPPDVFDAVGSYRCAVGFEAGKSWVEVAQRVQERVVLGVQELRAVVGEEIDKPRAREDERKRGGQGCGSFDVGC